MSPFFVTIFSFYTYIKKYFRIHTLHKPNSIVLLVDYTSK
jgi:hypothetical protein